MAAEATPLLEAPLVLRALLLGELGQVRLLLFALRLRLLLLVLLLACCGTLGCVFGALSSGT